MDAGEHAEPVAGAGAQRGARIRRRVHRAAAARVRRVRHPAAQPGPPGQGDRDTRPAEPRANRGRDRHRRPGTDVLRLRRRRRPFRRSLHGGPGAHEGVLDRVHDRVRRRLLAGARRGDGAQAGSEAILRRSGSAAATRLPCGVPYATGTASSARAPRRPTSLPTRCAPSARRWKRPGATRPRFRSPSACT